MPEWQGKNSRYVEFNPVEKHSLTKTCFKFFFILTPNCDYSIKQLTNYDSVRRNLLKNTAYAIRLLNSDERHINMHIEMNKRHINTFLLMTLVDGIKWPAAGRSCSVPVREGKGVGSVAEGLYSAGKQPIRQRVFDASMQS